MSSDSNWEYTNYESVDDALGRLEANDSVYRLSGTLVIETTGSDAAGTWHVICSPEGFSVSRGTVEKPNALVRGEHDTVLRVLSKTEDPRRAIGEGRLEVDGDVSLAYAITHFLIPPAEEAWAAMSGDAHFAPFVERAGAKRIEGVERVPSLSPGAAVEALSSGTPLIIENATERWPARHWTPKFLADKYGDVPMFKDGKPCAMSDVIAAIEAAGDPEPDVAPYIQGARLSSGIAGELDPTTFLPPELVGELTSPSLWIGCKAGGRLSTALHRDQPHGLHAVIYGRKRFIVFSPDQEPYLKRGAPWDGAFFGGLNPEKPDLERFPEYEDARPIEFELGPGDLLLIPIGWYHCVRTLSTCIAVAWGLAASALEYP